MADNAQNSDWPQNAGKSTYSAPIDFNTARTSARQFGDGTTYALDFEQGGKSYTFIPSNVAQNGGVTAGDNTYLLPYFTDQKNLDSFSKSGQKTDLSSSSIANYLKSQGHSTQGFLVPTDQANFDSNIQTMPTSNLGGSLTGLKKEGDQIVVGLSGGGGSRYLTSSGEVHNPTTTYSSILGDVFGSAGQSLADAWQSLGPIGQLAAAYYGGGAIADALGASAAGDVAGQAAAGDFSGALPADYAGYTPPNVTDLGTVAGSTEGIASGTSAADLANAGSSGTGLTASPGAGTSLYDAGTNLSNLGGAQGLAAGTTLAGLADMGGAQGLTGALAGGAAGEALGAAGAGGALTPAAADIGAGLGLSDAATGAGSALAGTAAASGLGSAAGSAAGSLTGSALGDAALISSGTGLVGSALQAGAAQNAANTQSAAAQQAIAQQQANFNLINAQQAPYRAAGYGALNKLAQLGGGSTAQYDANGNRIADLGSPSTPSAIQASTASGPNLGGISIPYQRTSITPPSGWQKGSDYGSPNPMGTPYRDAQGNLVGWLGAQGFTDVSGNPVQGGSVNTENLTPQTDSQGKIIGFTSPTGQSYDANGNAVQGGTSLSSLGTTGQSSQTPSDYLTHQFNASDLQAGLAPNYDFMLQQGQMANQRAANAGGGALGGNALQGLQKYTQDYAGNAYQNAFTNYQNQRTNIYNTLAGIAGIGQTGQSAVNAASTNATNAATQLGVGSAAAQAAGTTGAANAYGNALGNIGNNITLASLLNQTGSVKG
jgi:hypothetical protein